MVQKLHPTIEPQPRHAELVSASKKQSNSQDSEQNKIYANKLA